MIILPCSDLLTSTSQVEPFKILRWAGIQFPFSSLPYPHYFPSDIFYLSEYIHLNTHMYVYVHMYLYVQYMHVGLYYKVCLLSFITFLGRLFKAVVTLLPFALYKEFSKSGLCQSYKPLPLQFSFWCWSFLTTCCFWISNSQAFTSLSIWLLLNHSYLFYQ